MLSYFNGSQIAKSGNKVIHLCDKADDDGFSNIELKAGEEFTLMPSKTGRTIWYITAPSGAGKSYLSKQIIQEYHKQHQKNPVYVFSSLESDPTLDTLKYIKRIKISRPEFLESELTAEDFKDSLVLYDDIDCISDRKKLKKVQDSLNSILQTGRHFNCSCIYTSHASTSGNATKMILNESHIIVLFPSCAGGKMLKYIGEQYLGLSKKQIERMKDLKSRWFAVVRQYPRAIITQHEVSLLKNF